MTIWTNRACGEFEIVLVIHHFISAKIVWVNRWMTNDRERWDQRFYVMCTKFSMWFSIHAVLNIYTLFLNKQPVYKQLALDSGNHLEKNKQLSPQSLWNYATEISTLIIRYSCFCEKLPNYNALNLNTVKICIGLCIIQVLKGPYYYFPSCLWDIIQQRPVH